jgi:steroid 5-alpha reductase family enzyme
VSWGPLLVNLAVCAGVVAVLVLATFLYAARTKVHAIMDTVWPLGFAGIAAVSFGLSAGHGAPGRRALVLALTGIWGLRLGGHIFARNFGKGEDKRYASLLRRNRGSLWGFVLRHIYWVQGRAMWFVSLPLQVAMYIRAPVSAVDWLGVAVWAVGFGFETVGDAQLRRFRAVAAPIYMTNMLVRHTGKKLLEKHMARSKGAAYADYVSRTSGLIPRPPRAPGASWRA